LDKIRTKKTLLLAGAILASAALFIMPTYSMVCSRNVMDYGCFHQFYGAISCFFVGDNLGKKTTMGFAMQSFFIGLALTCIKTTVNFTYLGVDNTAPLGIIPDSVKLLLFWWNRIYCNCTLTVITSKEYSPEELALEKHKETSLIKKLILQIGLHLMENLT
jgi:maltose/moltooligosaccharide transporter